MTGGRSPADAGSVDSVSVAAVGGRLRTPVPVGRSPCGKRAMIRGDRLARMMKTTKLVIVLSIGSLKQALPERGVEHVRATLPEGGHDQVGAAEPVTPPKTIAEIGADTNAATIPVTTPAMATHRPARSRRR